MSQPQGQVPVTRLHLKAVAHFHAERFDGCIAAARYNLTNPTLSRYYRMENLLLIAGAQGDWYAGERRRREMNQLWYTANRLMESDDEYSQKALREVREDLDELTVHLQDEESGEVDESLVYPASDDEEEEEELSDTEMFGDDEATVLAAGAEVFGDDEVFEDESDVAATYERAAAVWCAAREEREKAEDATQEWSDIEAIQSLVTESIEGTSEAGQSSRDGSEVQGGARSPQPGLEAEKERATGKPSR